MTGVTVTSSLRRRNILDRDGLAGGADAGFAGIREADDFIRVVVADRHEKTLLLGVVVEMVAGALTGGEAAVSRSFMMYPREPRIRVAPPFKMKMCSSSLR
jgi:hypothetical protein